MRGWLGFLCLFAILAAVRASDTNIAFGKPVTASGATLNSPGNITDNDSASYSHPQTIPSQGFYFQVDLGQEFPLEAIYLYSRVECCADRLSQVRMSVFADAGGAPGALNWSYDIRPGGEPNPQGGVDILTASLHPGGTFRGRFLRITNISNTTYAPQVAEIEAYEVSKPDIRFFGPDAGNITATGAPGKPTQATLSWNVQGYTSLSINQGIGTVTGPLGSAVVSPPATTTYTLTAFNGLASVTKSVTIGVDQPEQEPRLSEFLASNVTGLQDSNDKRSGWIEIANPNAFAINLKDYYLTDKANNLTKWKFPAFAVPGNGYAIVFADNTSTAPEPFEVPHTNFTLDPEGEYVALVAKDGVTILGQFPATYPNPQTYPIQSDDHSYGAAGGIEGFFAVPTPNAPNGTLYDGVVAGTVFTTKRGFYDTPQAVGITCATPGAQIRYTLNGSAPTATTGSVYSAPIAISSTTVLRAAAFKTGSVPTNVDTQTYIFTASVIASTPWAAPNIISDPTYGPQMIAALKQVPSVSLTTGPGVTVTGGADKLAALEWIDPAGGADFQSTCGVSLFGGAFTNFAKKSFRLAFKGEFGQPKLKFPLFAGFERGLDAAKEFDYLELRGGSHDMVERGFYMSNPFTDATMLDMGSFGPHQRFVHVYLNGVYWGLYQLRERWGADMVSSYYGGDRSEYESINGNLNVGGWADGLPYDGTGAIWTNMKALARSGPDTYAKLRPYLDTPQFVDYMIMFMFGNSEDEYRACGPAGPGHGFKFLLNDADGFLRTSAGNRTAMNSPGKAAGDGPGSLFSMLFKDGGIAYRRLLAERIHRAYVSPSGALTPVKNAARLTELCNAINLAINCECARWNYRTPANWASSRDSILSTWFPTRTATVLGYFKTAGFYPDPEAPVFNPAPGTFTSGTLLSMSSSTPNTKVYYTTNGLDPLATENIAYNAPLITATTAGKYHVPTSAADGFDQTAIPNLIAYWPFDSNAVDTVNGFNGTLVNGATIGGPGKFGGGGLILDGINDCVAIGNPAGLQILGQITISAWVKASNVSGLRNIVNKGHDTNNPNGEITLRVNGGGYQGGYWAGAAGSVVTSSPVAGANSATADVGVWTHIVSVWDGAMWRLYRNGVEIATAPSGVGAVTVPTVGWAIGARGTGTERYFAGEIDEVRIYDRGLNAAEIGALYNNTLSTAGATWAQPSTSDATWDAASGALGFAPPGDTLAQGVAQEIGAAMRNVNASVFVRIPFNLTTQERLDTQLLRLRVRSDDGFIAYLNGARIGSRNAPVVLSGTSAATGETPDADALAGETIDINSTISLLRTGANVLAIQGLNLSANNDDFLLGAELESHRGNPGLSPSALTYTAPIPLTKSTLIKARSYSEITKQWSALAEGFYQVGPDRCPPGALAISELHYNPSGDDDGEFMELMNVSSAAINLQGAYFTFGVEFTFPTNRTVSLAPGQRIVLVDSQFTFQKVHGIAETVGGIYAGNLSNSGERITIVSADGLKTLLDFTYSDLAPWPEGADGGGGSLVFINPGPGRDPNDPTNWRVSETANGNPNADDTIPADLLPVITSGSQFTLSVGQFGSFTVKTNGLPAPSISIGGVALPAGVVFLDNGDGTAAIFGTPEALTGGVYELTLSASNTQGVSAPQAFTLTVKQAPVITSGNSVTFTVVAASAFAVTTKGYPAAAILIAGDPLPQGLTFVSNGDGTGSLAGTPTVTGNFAITFTAVNSEGVSAPQNFALTVNQPPAITSAGSATFIAGTAKQFVVMATGHPVPGISIGGAALPQGVSFSDNGDGTALLSGTAGALTHGTYALQFTAANGVNPDALQSFSLSVYEKPVVTSALSATGRAGTPFSYQLAASNGPTSFAAGPLPDGLSVNAAGRISGTPTADGTTLVILSATNIAGTGTAVLSIQIAPQAVIPIIASAPTATPNPAKVGGEVRFSAAGNPTGVTWSWNFGDGAVDTTNTSSPKHTYAAKGSYQVTATLTNILGQAVSAQVAVVVTLSGLPPGTPATIVPLEIMAALGLDPEDPAQSPLGSNESERLAAFAASSATAVKLNYKVPGKDQIALKFSLQAQNNTAGKQVVTDFGGVVKIFTLQAKGKNIVGIPAAGNKKDSLKLKSKAGVWTMTASFKDGAFVEMLKKINGFGKEDSAAKIRYPAVDFHMLYDGYLYRSLGMPLVFTLNAKGDLGKGKSR